MRLFNKGQGLSLNVVIIAALALIVLIVLVFIFSGKLKIFGQGTESCANMGGKCTTGRVYQGACRDSGQCDCPDKTNQAYISGTDCEAKSEICCKQIL